MRHIYANRAVYIIATVLILASVLFAWLRSQQIVVVPEGEIVAAEFADVTSLDAFNWQELGAETYRADCATCHGDAGEGRDAYPPLRVGIVNYFNVSGGRSYLIDVMLYGLESDRHEAPMPDFYSLSDAQVAAVLNYSLTSWGNAETLRDPSNLYIPSDIAAERGKDLSPEEVTRP